MSEWKPIETAPTGERVLLNWQQLGHIECGTRHDDSEDGRPYFVLFDGDSMFIEPTHWMPLPEPPEAPND